MTELNRDLRNQYPIANGKSITSGKYMILLQTASYLTQVLAILISHIDLVLLGY
jgi:hypothetical protein